MQRVEEAPPGLNGVIIQVDLAKCRQEGAQASDCLKIFSLKLVEEKVIEEVSSDSVSQNPQEESKTEQPEVEMRSDDSAEDEDQDEADEKRRAEHAQMQMSQGVQQEYAHNILPKLTDALREMVTSTQTRISNLEDTIKYFKFIIPKVVSRGPKFVPSRVDTQHSKTVAYERFAYQKLMSHRTVTQTLKWSNILFFPHKNLVQYDCGKLQRLA